MASDHLSNKYMNIFRRERRIIEIAEISPRSMLLSQQIRRITRKSTLSSGDQIW
jgi:hypothetical protein